ncbi:hypothetical protein [Ferrimonas marina]|uniref:Uncharacterized protein n=1 Tax=Ferrimonas marina TaxID=299255 RepID=A0A1M5U8W3_9GAMM|nr:hypothetical protein [Ferrimonas marina]SHH59370.1 hypothetical protein SAMN02745129_2456 [Ferrimonas marina]
MRYPKTAKEIMDFQLHGRLPKESPTPETPLRALLAAIYPRDRSRLGAIQLGPELGFNCRLVFDNAEQLLRWLGHNQTVRNNAPLAYQSHQDSRVSKVTLAMLNKHLVKPMDDKTFKDISHSLKRQGFL